MSEQGEGDSAGRTLICLPFLQERVGNFLADFYSVNGLVLESRKRREHLSEEDILRNKAIMESLSKGGNLIEQNFEVSRGGGELGLLVLDSLLIMFTDAHALFPLGANQE